MRIFQNDKVQTLCKFWTDCNRTTFLWQFHNQISAPVPEIAEIPIRSRQSFTHVGSCQRLMPLVVVDSYLGDAERSCSGCYWSKCNSLLRRLEF